MGSMSGWIFLAVSLVGLLATANAYRPLRVEVLSVFTFFTGWLVSELPLHTIAWQLVATLVFASLGAFHHPEAWWALAVTVVSWVGLVNLARQAHRAGAVTDAALTEGLGAGWGAVRDDRVSSAGASTTDWLHLVFAWWLRDRRIERVRNLDYWGDGIHRHRLDIYRSREASRKPGPAPVFVYVHGGGWVMGDKREQGLPLMLFLAAQGWVCVTVNYRLSPKATWPDHLVDVKKALAWVRGNIAEYGGDPGFVAVSGGSAGGHLASLAALTPNDSRYQPGFETANTSTDACVSFYGVYDLLNRDGLRGSGFGWFMERTVMKRTVAQDPQLFRDASPMDVVSAGAPPFMAVHGSNDSLVPVGEARAFVRLLKACASRPVVYAELPGAQHAFEVFRSLRTAHVVGAVADFLSYTYAGHRAGGRTGAAPVTGREATPAG